MGQINIRRALSLCSAMQFYNLTHLVCVCVCVYVCVCVCVCVFLGMHMLIWQLLICHLFVCSA